MDTHGDTSWFASEAFWARRWAYRCRPGRSRKTRMVRHFGRSVHLGPVGFSPSTSNDLSGPDGCGRAFADLQRATRLLTEHRRALDQVVELQRETSDGSAVEEVVAGHNGLVSSLSPVSAVRQRDRTSEERGDG